MSRAPSLRLLLALLSASPLATAPARSADRPPMVYQGGYDPGPGPGGRAPAPGAPARDDAYRGWVPSWSDREIAVPVGTIGLADGFSTAPYQGSFVERYHRARPPAGANPAAPTR